MKDPRVMSVGSQGRLWELNSQRSEKQKRLSSCSTFLIFYIYG